MDAAFRLRDARLADLDALLALEDRCFPPAQAYPREQYRYALATARAVNLLAEDEAGRIAGFVGAFYHRARRAGHVYTLNVDPTARRRGLGARLMAACEARVTAAGGRRVVLEVNVENEAGIALYERLGYARMGRVEGYYSGYNDDAAYVYAKLV